MYRDAYRPRSALEREAEKHTDVVRTDSAKKADVQSRPSESEVPEQHETEVRDASPDTDAVCSISDQGSPKVEIAPEEAGDEKRKEISEPVVENIDKESSTKESDTVESIEHDEEIVEDVTENKATILESTPDHVVHVKEEVQKIESKTHDAMDASKTPDRSSSPDEEESKTVTVKSETTVHHKEEEIINEDHAKQIEISADEPDTKTDKLPPQEETPTLTQAETSDIAAEPQYADEIDTDLKPIKSETKDTESLEPLGQEDTKNAKSLEDGKDNGEEEKGKEPSVSQSDDIEELTQHKEDIQSPKGSVESNILSTEHHTDGLEDKLLDDKTNVLEISPTNIIQATDDKQFENEVKQKDDESSENVVESHAELATETKAVENSFDVKELTESSDVPDVGESVSDSETKITNDVSAKGQTSSSDKTVDPLNKTTHHINKQSADIDIGHETLNSTDISQEKSEGVEKTEDKAFEIVVQPEVIEKTDQPSAVVEKSPTKELPETSIADVGENVVDDTPIQADTGDVTAEERDETSISDGIEKQQEDRLQKQDDAQLTSQDECIPSDDMHQAKSEEKHTFPLDQPSEDFVKKDTVESMETSELSDTNVVQPVEQQISDESTLKGDEEAVSAHEQPEESPTVDCEEKENEKGKCDATEQKQTDIESSSTNLIIDRDTTIEQKSSVESDDIINEVVVKGDTKEISQNINEQMESEGKDSKEESKVINENIITVGDSNADKEVNIESDSSKLDEADSISKDIIGPAITNEVSPKLDEPIFDKTGTNLSIGGVEHAETLKTTEDSTLESTAFEDQSKENEDKKDSQQSDEIVKHDEHSNEITHVNGIEEHVTGETEKTGDEETNEIAIPDGDDSQVSMKMMRGEVSAKTTYQRTSTGPIAINEVSPEGKFIVLENTSSGPNRRESKGKQPNAVDVNLDGWKLKRTVDGKRDYVYNFKNFTLKAGKKVKILARGSASEAGLNDLVFREEENWGVGLQVTTSLINDKDEEKASHVQRTLYN